MLHRCVKVLCVEAFALFRVRLLAAAPSDMVSERTTVTFRSVGAIGLLGWVW